MTIAWTDSDLAYHTQVTNAFTHSEDSFCDEEGERNPALKKNQWGECFSGGLWRRSLQLTQQFVHQLRQHQALSLCVGCTWSGCKHLSIKQHLVPSSKVYVLPQIQSKPTVILSCGKGKKQSRFLKTCGWQIYYLKKKKKAGHGFYTRFKSASELSVSGKLSAMRPLAVWGRGYHTGFLKGGNKKITKSKV